MNEAKNPNTEPSKDAGATTGAEFAGDERFETGASRYADYLRTTEGRLRLDLAWLNLREFVGQVLPSGEEGAERRALDVGGGTGALALRLAADGWGVAVLDSSAAMLALASASARRAGHSSRVSFQVGDAARAAEIFPPASFDLVACHNVIEYVEDPAAVVKAVGAAARRGAVLSLLARNRAGEAMRAAIKSHDLEAARHALVAASATESLYGGPAKLFDAESLRALASDAGLEVLASRGVRVVADYLPAALSHAEEDYARLLDFEHTLGARDDFAAVARYVQVIARRK
ncbi:MAG: methyltransferase domain-containing protein [Acidobacteria bacterium]|nr:methyltransferase domain-containing protein [Acidobacteriota bacterium]